MAFRNILFVISLTLTLLASQFLFFSAGASSVNHNIQPASQRGRRMRFTGPTFSPQLRTVPVKPELCSVKDLDIVSHVVREDYVMGEVTNNCKYCGAVDNIIVDCSQVKSPMGTTCKLNYPIAFGEKWRFPYRGKPTSFKIISADFQNCQ